MKNGTLNFEDVGTSRPPLVTYLGTWSGTRDRVMIHDMVPGPKS